MTERPVRVVKLGGSLLDWPEWVGQFRRWLSLQPPAANAIVVGGGAFVDHIRRLDRAHGLSAETAHWLAIEAMSLTATIAAELLGEAALVRLLDELRLSALEPQILDVRELLLAERNAPDALPCSWEVTSDSIAARVASRLNACELVLLKSALPADPAAHELFARNGFVDSYFPQAAHGLTVRLVNLRDARFAEATLYPKYVGS